METKTFKVPNIGCAGCVRTIETELGDLAGVSRVQADQASKMVTVEWNAPADWPLIESKLVEIEYPPAQA